MKIAKGGQGLRGQGLGGRRTVVIGGTFRRDLSSLKGVLSPQAPSNYIFRYTFGLECAEQSLRAASAPKGGGDMTQSPCLRPWSTPVLFSVVDHVGEVGHSHSGPVGILSDPRGYEVPIGL